jgi:hypothetical protein
MTATTKVKDSQGREFRIVRQKTQVTCGPACCLIMWANVWNSSPEADEGGVISLTKRFPKPWNAATGAEINNLSSVLGLMSVRTKVETHTSLGSLKSALGSKVQTNKPALVFVEWETAASVRGHFVVVGAASSASDSYTILDPFYGLQEMTGLPYYYPDTSEADPPSLKFSGAVAFVE